VDWSDIVSKMLPFDVPDVLNTYVIFLMIHPEHLCLRNHFAAKDKNTLIEVLTQFTYNKMSATSVGLFADEHLAMKCR